MCVYDIMRPVRPVSHDASMIWTEKLCLFVFCAFLSAVLGKVRSAVGSAQLLMSQKFQQFRGLCEQNLVCTTSL